MREKRILINTFSLAKDFVYKASKVDELVNVKDEKGKEINGKSIMGIFTLNLTKPLYVQTNSKNDEFNNFLKKIEV